MAVHDEENLALDGTEERFQEVDETPGIHAALLDAEAQFATRRDCRYHAYRFPFAGLYDHWRLASGTPGRPGMVIGPQPGLILEEDASALLRGELADLRVDDLFPLFHALR